MDLNKFVGGNNLLLRMWGVNAAAPLNSVHFGYGLGAVFVNLLVRPFITKKFLPIDNTNSTLSMVNPNIVIPYSITSVLCVGMALGHIFFYISKIRNRREKLKIQQVIRNKSTLK